MRKIFLVLLASASLGLTGVQAGSAADVQMPTFKAPAPFSWTGYYFGAQAGGGAFDPDVTAEADPGVGFLLGGQVGYNHQFGMLVLGIEGEGFWSSMNDQLQNACTTCGFVDTYSYKNTGDFDIAARAGLAIFDRALIYAKGGFVLANYSFHGAESNLYTSETASGWLPAVLIGAGFQYALPPVGNPLPGGTLVVGMEYNYISLNTTTLTANYTCPSCTPTSGWYDFTASGTKQIVKLRVDWLFNGP